MRRRAPPKAPEKLSPDDAWFAGCDKEVAKAMAHWMKETINVRRPINSLTSVEMTTLARVAVDTWITLQSRRPAEQAPYPRVEITL